MRTFLLSLAVALAAASLPGPTPMASIGPSYAATLDFGGGTELVQAKKKKKNRSKSTNKKMRLDDIGGVKRGKRDLKVRATVTEPGLTCHLVLSYADGGVDSPDNLNADNQKNCVFRVDIPRRASAVGQATAALYVYDPQGRVEGTVSTVFEVLN